MENLDAHYWNQRYANNKTGWDIGSASPPLTQFIDSLTNKNTRILIPGCGNAYEAQYLLENGFQSIFLIDLSPIVVENIRVKFSDYIHQGYLTVVCGDFFLLEQTFDLILEQTFFCALPVKLRKNYASKMHELLAPKGKLVGLLFDFPLTEEGPPFGGNATEYKYYFSSLFTIEQMEQCPNSIKPRAGRELFFELSKI